MVPAVAPDDEASWIDAAAAHFDGEVVLGQDLLSLDV